jgi:lysophospholipase L1-like esterase
MEFIRNTALLLASIIVALLLAEGILRLYNPFETRIRGDQITLRTDFVYKMPNHVNPKLAPKLIHTRNNIGLRGPDWPPKDENAIRIFAVGGSTTECFYLSDGLDWPAILARKLNSQKTNVNPNNTLSDPTTSQSLPFWVNNAGLDGHSTFGHRILLREILHQYEPHYILYLVGANDVGRWDLTDHHQKGISAASTTSWVRTWRNFITHNSELGALAENLVRGYRARSLGVNHQNINFSSVPHIETTEEDVQKTIAINNSGYTEAYRQRLTTLVEKTLELNIQPILITQPVPYGPTIDPETGINMATIQVRYGSGYQRWREVELYNDITREVASMYDILLIDLEQEMPKNTIYYYDFIHFTEEGANEVGKIIGKHVQNRLALETN